MIPNPFLSGVGPQAAGLLEPMPTSGLSENDAWAAQQRARSLQAKMAARAMVADMQSQNTTNALGKLAGTGLRITLGKAAASASGAAVLDSSSSTLSSAASGLGAIAGAYGAYAGATEAGKNISRMNRAVGSGDLSPQEVDELKQREFNSAMVNFGIGTTAGLATGSIPGAVLGGVGGATQAYRTYDNFPDAARAFGNFVKNPFKK